MAGKFIAALVNRARSIFREKTPVNVEDFEQEHLLIYHGLIGSSPDNQKSFRDVRSDIQSAVTTHSSIQLGVALKLAPLYWEDKLLQIFTEFKDKDRADALITLLPNIDSTEWPSLEVPLGHPDWRVRANAARILAFLKADEAVTDLAKSLDDTASSSKPAFAHITRALGIIGGEQAKNALIKHLNSAEPWFRVDAIAAIANWPITEVREPFINSVLTINPLSDYLAVSVARKTMILELLRSDDYSIQNAACQIIVGILEAANQTFTLDLLNEFHFQELPEILAQIVKENINVITLRSLLRVTQTWSQLTDNDLEAQELLNSKAVVNNIVETMQQVLSSESTKTIVKDVLTQTAQCLPHINPQQLNELQHAVKLAGELKLEETNSLVFLLENHSPLKEDVIGALGKIGNSASAIPLVAFGESLYRPGERSSVSKSAQPVAEDDPEKAKLYWLTLQALGNVDSKQSQDFLLKACSDYAPDQRRQALVSLTAAHSRVSSENIKEFTSLVEESLGDPNSSVKIAAMDAVSKIGDTKFTEKILRLSDSIEVSVSKQAFKTLARLQKINSQSDDVVREAVKTKMRNEKDAFKLKKLTEFLSSIDRNWE